MIPVPVLPNSDLRMIVASLCGALAWGLNQQYFDRKKQIVAFIVSFFMGILGADMTLDILNIIVPGILCDDRAVGAFFCSALVITLITSLIHQISLLWNNKGKEK